MPDVCVICLVVHGDVWACGGIGDDLEFRDGRGLKECVRLVELSGHLRGMREMLDDEEINFNYFE